MGLHNAQEHHVCTVAVGVVGDLTRALEAKMAPYCHQIMQQLLQNLQNSSIDRSIKPHIVSCLGDIALAVEGYFQHYLQYAMPLLVQASQTTFGEDADYENQEYLNDLRESILEALTGFLQGLSSANQTSLMIPYIPQMFAFLDLVAADNTRTDAVTKAAVGVIGDVSSHLGQQVRPHLNRPGVHALVGAAQNSKNEHTKEAGEWAAKMAQTLLAQQ